MNPLMTSGLLAATMMLGQPGEPPTTGKAPPTTTPPATIVQAQAQPPIGPTIQQAQAQQPSRPIINWFSREDRPIMSKISNWWKRDPQDTRKDGMAPIPGKETIIRETPAIPVSKPTPTPAPAPNDYPRKLPNPQSKSKEPATTEAKVQQTNLQQNALMKPAKTPISAQFANKIGRDEKFEWITGQLEMESNNHVLYYATPETIDKYNGRIVLLPQGTDLTQFKKGDLISVRGQVTQRQTMQGMVPIYRVTNASLIERPKN